MIFNIIFSCKIVFKSMDILYAHTFAINWGHIFFVQIPTSGSSRVYALYVCSVCKIPCVFNSSSKFSSSRNI